MPSTPEPQRAGTEARGILRAFLERRCRGEQAEINDLYSQRPDLEPELRRLYADWRQFRGLSPLGSLSERLRQRYGEGVDPNVSLDDEGRAQQHEREPPNSLLEQLRQRGPGRYSLKGEIARGGMGAVLKVWDDDLRRYLAMKVVLGKAEQAGSSPFAPKTPEVDRAKLSRFLEEAQVTGQLDHPGIVPVHELGLDATGRVYFTMRLVKGRRADTW